MEIRDRTHCTFSPDKIFGYYIGDCCKWHDQQYRRKRKKFTRKETDEKFRKLLLIRLPTYLHFIAWIYYFAVRLFSGSSWKRWEYEWLLGIIPIKR